MRSVVRRLSSGNIHHSSSHFLSLSPCPQRPISYSRHIPQKHRRDASHPSRKRHNAMPKSNPPSLVNRLSITQETPHPFPFLPSVPPTPFAPHAVRRRKSLVQETLAVRRAAETRDAIGRVDFPLKLVVVREFFVCSSNRSVKLFIQPSKGKGNSLFQISFSA